MIELMFSKKTMTNLVRQLQTIDWDFPNSHYTNSIHNIHPYPAKFIPEIPHHLIKTIGVPKNSCVFDPFCGSGVTLVEAQNLGYPSIGIDLNPIACLISRVKTTTPKQNLYTLGKIITQNARDSQTLIQIPPIPNLDHWFKKDIQNAIFHLRHEISQTDCLTSQDALNLALSSILVRVSNQESDTRYAAIEKNYQASDVYKLFLQALLKVSKALDERPFPLPKVTIQEQNILHTKPKDVSFPVGLVITSPPYPNAYEYWLYHKYRMFWLGYDPIAVKKQEIGARAHYFKKNPPTIEDFSNQMQYVFNLLTKTIISGGHICIVIGRSKIHGKIIDNAKIISVVGERAGFKKVTQIERILSKSRKSFNLSYANIKKEHILIFRAN